MAIVLEQVHTGNTVAGNSVAVTLPNTTKAGSALFVVWGCYYDGFTPSSIVDNNSNTFGPSADVSLNITAIGVLKIFSAWNIAVATQPHIVTVNLSANYYIVTVVEVSGLVTSGGLDKTQTNSGSSYSSTATATTSQNDEFLLGAHHSQNTNANTTVPDAGWTQAAFNFDGGPYHRLYVQYRIVSATGAYASSGTVDTFSKNVIATYLGATGGGAPPPALKRNSRLTGLGASGPFFHDPLSGQAFARRDRIYVPARMAA